MQRLQALKVPRPRPDIVRGGVENDSFQPVRLVVPARWCLLD
jgi:hypothetical protein